MIVEIRASLTKARNSLGTLHTTTWHRGGLYCLDIKNKQEGTVSACRNMYYLHQTLLDTECRIVKKYAVVPFVIVFSIML